MLSRVAINLIRRSVRNNERTLVCRSQNPLQSDLCALRNGSAKSRSVQNRCNLYVAMRFKSKKRVADIKKSREQDDDFDEEEKDEEEAPVGSKVAKVKVPSLRLDAVSKAGFGISRSKAEEAFYASKIRINGKKVFKKSKEVEIGDEIDMILHENVDNPELLFVNRIVILSMDPTTDGVQIKLSKDRNLLIENYEDPYLSRE